MIESYLKYDDLIAEEPQLAAYIFTEDGVLSDLIRKSKENLSAMIENKLPSKGDLKKLCTRLTLTNATESGEDKIARRRLVIKISDNNANTFKLEGSNTKGGIYTTILDSAEISTASTTNDFIFDEVYSYYKLTQITGTSTFTAYLVETTFELPHKYLALTMAYRRLQNLTGDVFQNKSDYYAEMLDDALSNLNYSFDVDEDEEITDNDTSYNTTIIGVKK